ncbi:family 3 encapsulin nanocompartment shell protein [Plantactinospora sp. WMMB782]|uniref:family 3 encapsulin nanocompartment shell protein n=1 Tax=Plantactinospora sp. WMMB782 TaxID=3404121 RepID=UPI003B93C48A
MATTMQPSATALEVTRQTLADPSLTRRSPGEEFAWAVAQEKDGADVVVPIRAHLTASFPLFATRPRYTVRHLLKVASVSDRTLAFVREAPKAGYGAAGNTYATTPESGFRPSVEYAELTEMSVTVPVPDGLRHDPALLAAFVDYRVLVRLGVVENQALLHGTADHRIEGLLNLPEIRRAPLHGDLGAALTEAAGTVEETGGSCDGIVVHPAHYWELVRDGYLGRLGEAGIKVSRTRMMPRGQALLGDFRAAVTLLDPGNSSLAIVGDAIEARTWAGLAVHLPQHFLLLGGDRE